MPLGYLRRPLFLVLILYMAVLEVLHSRGHFDAWASGAESVMRYYAAVQIEAVVVSPLREDRRGEKVVVESSRVEGKGFVRRLLVFLPRAAPQNKSLRPGRRILIIGKLRLPRPARNPGEFDERGFLSDRGIAWIMKAESLELVEGPIPWRWKLTSWAESVRRSMENCFSRMMPQEPARVLTAIVLGYKGPLDRGLNRAFQDAGVMHILVPSGAKVAFVILACAALAPWLGLGVAGRILLCALVGGFYTLMVGADPPYARAYLGALALYAGLLLDRESGAFQATVISAWIVLVCDPRALFSAGFQMTYLAMAGLLLAMPSVNASLSRRWPRWLRRLAAVASVTIIVQLMLWPTFANIFGRGSVAGAAANLLLVPASGLIMAGGFVAWGLSLLTEGPALALVADGVRALVDCFCAVCLHVAAWPGAAVDLSPMSWPSVIAYYLGVSALLVLPRKRAALGLAVAAIAVWAGAACHQHATAWPLRVAYLRLPESQAAIVSFSGRRHWLVGRTGQAAMLLKALRAERIAMLERVIATSEDAAARRGLERLCEGLDCGRVHRISAKYLTLCEGAVCFSFDPPAVWRRASGSNGRNAVDLAVRLRKGAVEVRAEGGRFDITQ